METEEQFLLEELNKVLGEVWQVLSKARALAEQLPSDSESFNYHNIPVGCAQARSIVLHTKASVQFALDSFREDE